jgi:hypothetical protein
MKRFIVGMLALAIAAPAHAQVLDFEGVSPTYPFSSTNVFLQGFYNGGTSSVGTTGANYGIEFSSNALAICLDTPSVDCSNTSRGGLGNPNSARSALFFLSGSNTYMNRAAGFQNGFSFYYASYNYQGAFSVWSGLDGTGDLLASLTLNPQSTGCAGNFFCPFYAAGVSFSGTAQSVTFSGVADQIVFDDVTFGSSRPGEVPEPTSLALTASGLLGLAAVARRRRANA